MYGYYSHYNQTDSCDEVETKKAIEDFGKYQEEAGVPVIFVIFPLLFRLDNYPFVAEHEKIKEELKRNNIENIDLLHFLSEYKGPELWVHPTDQHSNEIVHLIAAEALINKFNGLMQKEVNF